MPRRDGERRGPATSFGTGSLPFEVARSGERWTWGKSLFVTLLGMTGLVLGLLDGRVVLPIIGGVIAVIGAIWMLTAWRQAQAARRLQSRP